MTIYNQWFSDLEGLLLLENIKEKENINFPTMLIVIDYQKLEYLNDLIALNIKSHNNFQIESIDSQNQISLIPNLRDVLKKMIQSVNFISEEYKNKLVLHIICPSNSDVQMIYMLLSKFENYHESFKSIQIFIYGLLDTFDGKKHNQHFQMNLSKVVNKLDSEFEVSIIYLNNQYSDGRIISDERLLSLIVGNMIIVNQNSFMIDKEPYIKKKIWIMKEIANTHNYLNKLYRKFIINAINQTFESSNCDANLDLNSVSARLKDEVNKCANLLRQVLRNNYSLMSLMPQIDNYNHDYSMFDISKSFYIESFFGDNLESLWSSQYESTAERVLFSQFNDIERNFTELICEFPLNIMVITSLKSQLSVLLTNAKMEMDEKYDNYLKFLDEPTSSRRIYKEKHLNKDFLLMDIIESYIQLRTHLLVSTKVYDLYIDINRVFSSFILKAEYNLNTLKSLYEELKRQTIIEAESESDLNYINQLPLVPICKLNHTFQYYKEMLERQFLSHVKFDIHVMTPIGETKRNVYSFHNRREFRIVMNEKCSEIVQGFSRSYALEEEINLEESQS